MATRPAQSDNGEESERFIFSRAGHLGADHQRTLRSLDEQFARNLTYTLGAWLRTDVAVNPLAGEQTTFFNFAERSTVNGYVVPVRMEPLHVRSALSLELCLLPPMVDLLLGGSGRPGRGSRDLTEIEEAILGSVFEITVRELNAAWRSLGVDFAVDPRESDSRDQRLMLATEKVIVRQFEVLMPELRGALSLCLSETALHTLMRQRSSLHGRSRVPDPEERTRMGRRLRKARTSASLQFPPFRICAGEVRRLQPGLLLRLDLPASAEGHLTLGGVKIFSAQPVRLGERRGARLGSEERPSQSSDADNTIGTE